MADLLLAPVAACDDAVALPHPAMNNKVVATTANFGRVGSLI
jgi:hypothetical protein